MVSIGHGLICDIVQYLHRLQYERDIDHGKGMKTPLQHAFRSDYNVCALKE